MYPYAGSVEVVGRVGALIDVRSGIHPQLTGRENICMFGALLGLGRRAGGARASTRSSASPSSSKPIDRQTKFYSSGMQMRLGFAVAAFLEPDVLLVDEVLAVGDTSFQQRCLEKMRSVQRSGATLVLVSHDLSAVEATCARTIWLHDGVVARDGTTAEVLDAYRATVEAAARADVSCVGSGADHEGRGLRARRRDAARPTARSTSGCGSRATRVVSVRLYVGLTEACRVRSSWSSATSSC